MWQLPVQDDAIAAYVFIIASINSMIAATYFFRHTTFACVWKQYDCQVTPE